MDAVHLHLIINHLPILGTIIGFFVLLYALLVKSRETRIAAAGILLAAGIGGFIANESGEGAEERVEELAGINEPAMEAHEESAETAMPFLLATSVLAAVSLIGEFLKKQWARYTIMLLTVAALGAAVASSYAGWLGGQIRHTELSTTGSVGIPTSTPAESGEEDDD
jgi:small neutral amino acid transporter SnatA (MarC family)